MGMMARLMGIIMKSRVKSNERMHNKNAKLLVNKTVHVHAVKNGIQYFYFVGKLFTTWIGFHIGIQKYTLHFTHAFFKLVSLVSGFIHFFLTVK